MDKTLVLKGLHINQVNRLISCRYDMGGKGINVSKVLNEFQVPSMATGFLGGIWKEYFQEELNNLNITNQFIAINGETRTNIKIVDEENNTFTDLNEKGPLISEEELAKFLKIFEELVQEEDLVVLSGGLCPGIPLDFYGTLTSKAKRKGAYVLVDAEGEALQFALNEKPDLIKPNEKEFAGLFGEIELNEEEMIEKAKQLIATGLNSILISRGEKGSLFINKDMVLSAKALNVPVKSTVGAGDAMVAALIYSKIHRLSPQHTLAMAQAAGASAVMTEGTRACTLKDVEDKLDLAMMLIKQIS